MNSLTPDRNDPLTYKPPELEVAVVSDVTTTSPASRWFQHSEKDVWLLGLALFQGFLSLVVVWLTPGGFWSFPALLAFAFALWWNSNTISHNHLHNPLFRSHRLNRYFSLYLSLLVSIPQTLWKERHLWHHAGEPKDIQKKRWSGHKTLEFASIGCLWLCLLWFKPLFWVSVFLPGWLLGLAFCQMQGHYEHLGEFHPTQGVSYYGRWYNWLWFNDGFHVEHHREPRRHWSLHTHAPSPLHHNRSQTSDPSEAFYVSTRPPCFRWMEAVTGLFQSFSCRILGLLERSSFWWKPSQQWMLQRHQHAFHTLLQPTGLLHSPTHTPSTHAERPLRVGIVGGGLFPRTLLALVSLLPHSRFVLIDKNPDHLEIAKTYMAQHGYTINIEYRAEAYDRHIHNTFDILVFPLAYIGDRNALYRDPPAPYTLVHDWIVSQHRGSNSVIISPILCKQLVLVVSHTPVSSCG